MGNWTPGPWRALTDRVGLPVISEHGTYIADCYQTHVGNGIANARLIASAPMLLEALQVLSEEADNFSVSGVYFNEKCMGHRGLDLAASAIAAATGETK